jgi:hypothetical protein
MQCDCCALVLDQRAWIFGRDRARIVADGGQRRRCRRRAAMRIGVATFEAVQPRSGQPQRREQGIEAGQSASADQRQCAVEPIRQRIEPFRQSRRHGHAFGRVGEVDQAAVHIEEQGPIVSGQGWTRPLVGALGWHRHRLWPIRR